MWVYTFIHNSKNNAKADIVLNSHDSVGGKYPYITVQIPSFTLFRWDGGFFFKTKVVEKKVPKPMKSRYSDREIEFLSQFGRGVLKTFDMKKYWKNQFLQQPPPVLQGRSGLLCFFVRFGGCPKRYNAKNIYPTQRWIFPSPKKTLLSYAKAHRYH